MEHVTSRFSDVMFLRSSHVTHVMSCHVITCHACVMRHVSCIMIHVSCDIQHVAYVCNVDESSAAGGNPFSDAVSTHVAAVNATSTITQQQHGLAIRRKPRRCLRISAVLEAEAAASIVSRSMRRVHQDRHVLMHHDCCDIRCEMLFDCCVPSCVSLGCMSCHAMSCRVM